jgi:hypothetical protein
MKSILLSNIHHAYAQTDGTHKFPNSQEGDMLKQAKKEIEYLQDVLGEISAVTQWNWDTMPEEGRKNCFKLIESLATEALKN